VIMMKVGMKVGIDVECINCRNESLYPYPDLKPFDIIHCNYCNKYSIILDSCLAHPDRLFTTGMVKQISFDKWVIMEMSKRFVINLTQNPNPRFNLVGTVENEQVRNRLIAKYNSDHPEDSIKIR
jgi:hypothetical protein